MTPKLLDWDKVLCAIVFMFIRRIGRKNGSTLLRIVENRRQGEQIKQVVVATLGTAKTPADVAAMERIGKSQIIKILNDREPVLAGFEDEFYKDGSASNEISVDLARVVEEKRICVGVEDVIGEVYSQLDFEKLIRGTKKDEQWNEILKLTVMSRIFDPVSKLQTSKEQLTDMGKSIPVEKIYRMMDRLTPFEQQIKHQVFQSAMSLLDHEVDVLFFDVTTLYFESFDEDELRQSGYSKDAKFKETQVVLALVTNNRGLPLTYELFAGKQHEGSTLINIVQKIKANYPVRNVVLVADRAMFSEQNLEFMESENIRYIVAAKLRGMKRDIKQEILSTPRDANWVKELSLGNRRLVFSYSLDRAKKDKTQRDKIVAKLLKKAKAGKVPVSSLISNAGTKKYVQVKQGQAELDQEKITRDEQWDGLHGVITNYKLDELDASSVLEKYRGLWRIEEVFRINKNDLKMRPIYHFKSERIRAHILICFIAYTLTAFVRQTLEGIGLKLSIRELRRELSKRQISIIRDKRSQRRYSVPSPFTDKQKMIYKAFNLPVQEQITPNWNQ